MAPPSFPPSIHKDRLPNDESLDDIAGEVLTFLAADGERLHRFFDITGLSPATLREAASAPGFAASLIDYIAGDERCLVAFAAQFGRDPGEFARLHQRLSTPPTED